jgi:hypothetical protein
MEPKVETEKKIYVEISRGCYVNAANVPHGYAVELIDWDNLLGNGDTKQEWNRLDVEARAFIKENYPRDYREILRRLESPDID